METFQQQELASIASTTDPYGLQPVALMGLPAIDPPIDPLGYGIELPGPIDPSTGQSNLLDIIGGLPLNDITNVLDQFPIPFAIAARAGEGEWAIKNWHASNSLNGGFLKLDVDNDKTTGQGGSGNDVQVQLLTNLLDPLTGTLLENPSLTANFERLGKDDFAEDVEIYLAFPFSAFTNEDLPGTPNLVLGFETTNTNGGLGGYLPELESMTFTAIGLGGLEHRFEIDLLTTNADNPLRFKLGHFDGDIGTGFLNASAINMYVQTEERSVPEDIQLALEFDNLFSFAPAGDDMEVALEWQASEAAKVVFEYREDESDNKVVPDVGTVIIVDEMPTEERLSFSLTGNPVFTLTHEGSAPINRATFIHQREDGLTIVGRAVDIPTEVTLQVDTDASEVQLEVNDNTMDLSLELYQEGGFPFSGSLLGIPISYLNVGVEDAPDLVAGFDRTTDPTAPRFFVEATNPGEFIGSVEAIADDDAVLDFPFNFPSADLDLAPDWFVFDEETHHIFSIVELEGHATAAARLRKVKSAEVIFGATDLSEALSLTTAEAIPLQLYFRFDEDAVLLPDNPNEEVEITVDVDDLPAGTVEFNYKAPFHFDYSIDPPTGIEQIRAYGYIGTKNFDITLGDLPAVFAFDFNPAGGSNLTDDPGIRLLAEDGFGGSAAVGVVALRLWDTGEDGLEDTDTLFGTNLFDATVRLDDIPSFAAFWSTGPGAETEIVFDTTETDAFLGGAQFGLSTSLRYSTPLAEASESSEHYLMLKDAVLEGAEPPEPIQELAAGVFGIDRVSMDTSSSLNLEYDANQARTFTATIDRDFGGALLPASADYDVELELKIQKVPMALLFSTDLVSRLEYQASSEIESITLEGKVDATDDERDNGTDIKFEIFGIPEEIELEIDPVTGASLTMSGPLDQISLLMRSRGLGIYDNDGDAETAAVVDPNARILKGIYDTHFRLIELEINDVSPVLSADWTLADADGFLLESTDTNGDPDPLGALVALLSTATTVQANEDKIKPFTLDGPDSSRIQYTEFTEAIDDRYWPAGVQTRLNELYRDSEELDEFEDHVVIRLNGDGDIDFASFQFAGFQKISIEPGISATGEINGGALSFKAPTVGEHPLFIGYEDGEGTFTTLQIEDVPNEITITLDLQGTNNLTGEITFTSDVSAGDIDFYQGPASAEDGSLFALVGEDAMRALILDTPSQLVIDWNLGIPSGIEEFSGVANFDANSPFEILFLQQDAGKRLVAGAQLEDLQINYGLQFPTFELDIDGPEFDLDELSFEFGSADVRLAEAYFGIDNDVDDPSIAGNEALQAVNGFFSVYELIESPASLDTGLSPSSPEYAPQVTVLLTDFLEFSVTVGLDIELVEIGVNFILDPFPDVIPFPQLSFTPEIDVDIDFDASLVLDYWLNKSVSEILDINVLGFDLIEIGFRHDPDYIDGTPFHILPYEDLLELIRKYESLVFGINEGFHDPEDHPDPYA